MASLKRLPSLGNMDDEDTRNAKMARPSREDDGSRKSPTPGPHAAQGIKIVVKLRSISKATRNDPKPPKEGKESNKPMVLGTETDEHHKRSTPAHQRSPTASIQAESPGTGGRQGSSSSRNFTTEAASPMEDNMSSDDSDHEHDGDRKDSCDGYSGYDDGRSSEISGLSSMDYFADFQWMEQIDGQATAGGTQVAYCDAKLIRRNQIRRNFWSSMEEPSQETSKLAFGLFDRYGLLNRQNFQHEIKKGTGVWREELDLGDILLFTARIKPFEVPPD